MSTAIEIPVGDAIAEALIAGDRGPGVLLYMDAIGLRPRIGEIADEIASWGYTVLAPNAFWRDGRAADLGPTGDLRIPEHREAFFASGVVERIEQLTPDRIQADAQVWLAALSQRADEVRGVIGYCFGGRLALRTAAEHDIAVVGMFHTGGIVADGPDSPHLVVSGVKGLVLAGHADQDRSNTPESIAAFDQALDDAGVRRRTAVYPGAPHGYAMSDTSMWNAAACQRHFAELREALDDA